MGVPLTTKYSLTAYDVKSYLREALPAMRAAIYRADLSQAKDVLALYDENLYEEYDLSQILVDDDFSWVFTENATDPESNDPNGAIIGLTYPLILSYHHPEVFQVRLDTLEIHDILPVLNGGLSGMFAVQPGYKEGLRAMWEIVGFISPEDTASLRDYCWQAFGARTRTDRITKVLKQIADGLEVPVKRGYGLVVERD